MLEKWLDAVNEGLNSLAIAVLTRCNLLPNGRSIERTRRLPLAVADLLSLSRVPMGLLICVLILHHAAWGIVVAIFAVGLVTDKLDGVIARVEGTTGLGALLDPLCDKFLVVPSVVALYPQLPDWWHAPFWVLVALDALTAIIAPGFYFLAGRNRPNRDAEVRSTVVGKSKFIAETIVFVLLLTGYPVAAATVFAIAIVLFLMAAADKVQMVISGSDPVL